MQAGKLTEDFLSSLWTSTQEIPVLNLERRRNGGFIQPAEYDTHTNAFFLLLPNRCNDSSHVCTAWLQRQDSPFLPTTKPVTLSVEPS